MATAKKILIATLIGLLTCQSGAAEVQPRISENHLLKRLLQIARVAQFAWSPEGDEIAYISNVSGTDQIHRVNLETRETRQITRRNAPVTDPQWSPDGNSLIFLTDPGWQERYEVWRFNFVNGEEYLLAPNVGAIQKNARWSPDSSKIVLETDAGGNFDLAIQDINDRVLRPFMSSSSNENSPAWDPTGRTIAFLSSGALWISGVEGGDPQQLVRPGFGGAIQTPAWSPDGKHLLFRTDLSGFWNIGVYSFADKTWRYVAAEPHEQSSAAWSRDGSRIAFITTHGFDKRLAIADLAEGEVRYLTEEGSVSANPKWSPKGEKLAFLMGSPRQTQDLWIYEDGHLNQVTQSMGNWRSSEFSSPESHPFDSREGFEIPGLLYKPGNFEPERTYPAVIVIHGGFYGQWVNSFELLGHYLSLRGMVLFYPNPRGSGGYGRMYERLNDGDWGGGDVEDLLRAHDYLTSLPFVDEDNIAIWGGSYGGYLSYALVTTAPERFQAAVVRAGISDLRSHMLERQHSPGRFNSISSYIRQLGGLPHERPEFYQERSPLNYSNRVKTPMLILHGLRDNRVSPNQSRIWVKALQRNGSPVASVEYPDDDHTLLRNKKTMSDQLMRMSDLFERHLGLTPIPTEN